jgi:hypothetical protein
MAGHRGARVLFPRTSHHLGHHLFPGAQEIDAPPLLLGAAEEFKEEVDARHRSSLRHRTRLRPSFAPPYGLLALVRTRRGHPEEASSWCGQAFAARPREPLRVVWHLALAWAALARGEPRIALDESQRGMAVNPDFATCYLSGAAAAHQLGLASLSDAWIGRLQERTVFTTLDRVRHRMPPAAELPHRQQMAVLIASLRSAGLPE